MTMMATRAITGTCDTQGLRATISTSRNTPANRVDRRPRPPYFTLPTAWPIMPQPAMPPNTLEAMLASPRPVHSRFLSLGVLVISSTTAAVSTDSSSPTMAIASAGSKMMRSVSRLAGTCGSPHCGSASGSWPRSATVATGRPSAVVNTVSSSTQINGEGITARAFTPSRCASQGSP